MKIEFARHNDRLLVGKFTAEPGEYYRTEGMVFLQDEFLCGREHEGVWNSRLLSFRPLASSTTHFSDGVPVAVYEKFQ
jgi:hypothetical protein